MNRMSNRYRYTRRETTTFEVSANSEEEALEILLDECIRYQINFVRDGSFTLVQILEGGGHGQEEEKTAPSESHEG